MEKILVYECPHHVDCIANDIIDHWDDEPIQSVKRCLFGRQVCKAVIYPEECPTETLIKALVHPEELFEKMIGAEEAHDILNEWRYDLVLKEIVDRSSCSNCAHQKVCKYMDAYNSFIDAMTNVSDEVEADDIFDVIPVCKLFSKIKENVR